MLYLKNALKTILLLTALLFLGSQGAYSATEQHFKLSASPSVKSAKAGEKFWLKVEIKFDKGWHSYGTKKIIGVDGFGPDPTSFKIEPKDLIKIDGKIITPKVKKKYDEAFEVDVELLEGNSIFELPVLAKKDIDFSKDIVKIIVTMQQCDERSCLPTDDFPVKVGSITYATKQKVEQALADIPADTAKVEELPIAEKESAPASQAETVKTDNKDDASTEVKAEDKPDLLTTLILSMLAGFGAFITPCVFPMVPITVSFFTKRSEQNKGKGLRDALIYGLGIIVTFTAVGLIFSLTMGATGVQSLTASPWFNLAIVGIFLLFGFSLFGAYELQLPTSWTNKLNSKSMNSSGVSSVILMSITFALTSFSCTGPLIGAALVSASNGEWFYPMVSMLGFSTTLAAPFFLLALFPSALNSLPKAGGWMNNVKVILGFIVLAITLKYLNNALLVWDSEISRELFLSVWIGIALLCTLYIIGVFKTSHDSNVDRVSTVRLMFGLVFASITFYLIAGFSGSQLGFLESFLPMAEAKTETVIVNSNSQAQEKPQWFDNYKDALADAISSNQMLLIDFTGKTCTNCKVMEKKLYPNADIQNLFTKFSKAKLYTDLAENKEIQLKKFNSVALPLYAIINPADESIIATITFTDNADEFIAFLNKGLK